MYPLPGTAGSLEDDASQDFNTANGVSTGGATRPFFFFFRLILDLYVSCLMFNVSCIKSFALSFTFRVSRSMFYVSLRTYKVCMCVLLIGTVCDFALFSS